MGAIHRIRRWYKLNHGEGKEMREHGADVESCPHCDRETPVYATQYNWKGEPLSFSVCLWCDGLIEHSDTLPEPRAPYSRRSKPDLRPRYPLPDGRGRRPTVTTRSTARPRQSLHAGEPVNTNPGFRFSWLQL